MKAFDQFNINSRAEREAISKREYRTLVVLFTWLASNDKREYTKKEYAYRYHNIFGEEQIPFYITEGLIYRHVNNRITITYQKTGEYNVITQDIFLDNYTIKQRYEYIKAASNISLVQRLNCKIYNKQILFSEAIIKVPKETPLLIRKNNTIRFPYEEAGVRKWQIGQQQREQKAGAGQYRA